jgi:hypothetical protein
MQITGGTNVMVRNNYIDPGDGGTACHIPPSSKSICTKALQVAPTNGGQRNTLGKLTITGNYLDWNNYSISMGSTGGGARTTMGPVTITDNTVGPNVINLTGGNTYLASSYGMGVMLEWSNNRRIDTGEVMAVQWQTN